jgi:hypothetical protein
MGRRQALGLGRHLGLCDRGTEGYGGARLRGKDGVEECGGFGGRRAVADLPVAELDDPPGPVSAKGQVGGDERQAERTDQRGEGRQVDAWRQVPGRVGVRRDQAAGSAGPPDAGGRT